MNNIEGSQTTNGLSGNLLFYGGDDKIYNANHTLMPNSVGLNCTTTPKQGPVAVQVPGNANRYYYIYPGGAGSPLKYSIIDMTMQTGLGDVDNAFKNIQLRAVVAEGIIPIRKTNACNEYWVLSHNIGSSFYVEQITAAGIANFNAQNVGPASTSMGAYMDYAPATGKLAMLYGSFNVALFDFNAATGAVTNYVNVPLPSVPFCLEYYSVAFSPNGNKLYVGGGYGQNHLVQVDLANGNLVTSIATGNGGNTLKLGPDGKIYGGILYTAFIGIVNNPDLPGLACNYTPNAINTGNVTFSDIGLPHIGLHDFNSSSASIIGNSTICQGDSSTLTASGGTNYLWSTGASTSIITVTPSATTTYTVTVTSGNCTASATITVTVSNSVNATIMGNNTICAGDMATLNGSGGTSYLWSTSATTQTIVVSPTVTTTYTLTVSSGSCSDTAQYTVNVLPPPVASINGTSPVCLGSGTTLTASGGVSYLWNTSATTTAINITPTSTTTYTVTVTDQNGCSATATATVMVNALPTVIITGNNILCTGDNTTLNASGGISYIWNTGATTSSLSVSPTSVTTYTVTVTDNNGCTATATITLTVSPPPVASISNDTSICSGQTISIIAGGGNYSWSTGATSAGVTISPTTTTTYSVIVSIGSCTDTAYVTVTVNPDPVANAGPDISIIVGSNSQLNATGGGSYSWSPSGGLSCTNCPDPIASPSVTTTYCVVVTNGSGCTDSDCMTITIDINCGEIFVPTAFSPNNDNANDQFYVLGNCITQMHLAVFDRWGEKVFESDDQAKKWDGTYRGAILNSAVFVFYLDATLLNGEVVSLKGNVTLIR